MKKILLISISIVLLGLGGTSVYAEDFGSVRATSVQQSTEDHGMVGSTSEVVSDEDHGRLRSFEAPGKVR